MIEILPKIVEEYTCRQSVITEIAKALSYDYQMIALGAWRFPYNPLETSLGKSIAQEGYEDFYKHVRQYNGLWIKEINYINEDKVKSLVSERPVIVQSDVYFCNWFLGYKKYNISHFFIINGVNEEGYICIDPSMCNNYNYIKWRDLKYAIKKIFILEKEDVAKDICLREVIQKDMRCYLEGDLNGLIKFTERMHQNQSLYLESMGYGSDIFQVPIVDNIRQIYTYRLSYIEMIKYVSEYENIDWSEVIEMMELCVRDWKKIRNIIIKNLVRKQYLLENTLSFSELMDNIVFLEIKIANMLSDK